MRTLIRLITLLFLVSQASATTFSNVQFNTAQSNRNYIKTVAISGQTAYIESVLTNGTAAPAQVTRRLVSDFDTGESVKLTNVAVLAVFDNSTVNSQAAINYNQYTINCFENEDVKHTTNFIIGTNLIFGKFDVPITESKVEAGSILVFNNQYYPIRNILNVGTNTDEVELLYPMYATLSNTTQNIQAVYGMAFNPDNISYGYFDGTNDTMRIVGGIAKGGGQYPDLYINLWVSYYDIANEDFLMFRDNRLWNGSAFSLQPEYSVLFRYNRYWREWGNTDLRGTSTFSLQRRISTYNGNIYYASEPESARGTIIVSTNKFVNYNTLYLPVTNRISHVAASPDGAIIYAAFSTFSVFAGVPVSGNGAYIYKSTNYGAAWFALTNMGTRYWCSVFTADGTNLYAGTIEQGGSGYSTTGGVFYSSDGGNSSVLTTLRNSTYGGSSYWSHITINSASNIVASMRYGTSTSTNQGLYVANLNTTNFTKWTTSYIQLQEFIPHFSDTNSYYFIKTKVIGPSGTGTYQIAKITNAACDTVFVTRTDEGILKGVDYRGVCFSPVNPNIGFACYSRLHESAGNGRILKTTDRGRTWTDVAPANAYWNTVATWDGQTVYAATGNRLALDSCLIYYSTNGGTSWTSIQTVPNLAKLTMPNSNTVYGLLKLGDYNQDVSSAAGLLIQIDASENIVKLANGRLNRISQELFYNKLKNLNVTNFFVNVGFNFQNNISSILTSTNSGDYFNVTPHINGAGGQISDMYYAKGTNIGYISRVAGHLSKTTNFFVSNASAEAVDRARRGVWCTDNGLIVYNAIFNTANLGLLKSTNDGVTFTTAVTNQANWQGLAGLDGGNVVLMSRDNGTMGLLTNAITAVNTTVTFIAGSPSAYSLNVVDSNTIWAFFSLAGRYYQSTNRGVTWTTNSTPNQTNTIFWMDRSSADTNVHWVTTSDGIFYTSNNFTTVSRWSTNDAFQMFANTFSTTSFDIDKVNTGKLFLAHLITAGTPTGNGLIGVLTNWPSTGSGIIYPSAISGLSKYWTDITTYDGETVYAVPGFIAAGGSPTATDYVYRIKFDYSGGGKQYIAYSSFLDSWRPRVWTALNTPNGVDVWGTTRIEMHTTSTTPAPSNYYSLITTCTAPTSSSWISINDAVVTANVYTNNYQNEVYMSISFDDGRSYSVWEDTYWRPVATNDTVWKYWTGSAFTSAYTNSATAALSQAMQYSTNRMTTVEMTSISPAEWSAQGGLRTNSVTNLYVGVTMRGDFGKTPNIRRVLFDYNSLSDQFRKKNAVTDGYKIEFEPTNGVYTIYRTGDTTDTYIYFIRR